MRQAVPPPYIGTQLSLSARFYVPSLLKIALGRTLFGPGQGVQTAFYPFASCTNRQKGTQSPTQARVSRKTEVELRTFTCIWQPEYPNYGLFER